MFALLRNLFVVCLIVAGFGAFLDDDEPAQKTLRIPQKPSASAGIYVQDNAEVLSEPVYRYLQSLGRQLDQKTTAQLAVVTVNSLHGAPLEDYSLQILRQWGIGSKEKNNGVLMLISTGDRKSRVEVGYGLEGALTDSLTGQIQDQYMLPYFRKGNYEEGIVRGYEALAQAIAKEYNVQLAVSGYADHSPGNIKVGNDGQSTKELFDKALAEQNGTAVPGSETQSGAPQNAAEKADRQGTVGDAEQKDVTDPSRAGSANQKTASSAAPESGSAGANHAGSGEASSLSAGMAAKAAGVLGFVFLKAEALIDSFGWVPFIIILVLLDVILLNGFFTRLFFRILAFFFSGGGGGYGGGSGGGYSGGGFGGGSGGGGGSSRSW